VTLKKKAPPQAMSQRAVREGRFNETLERMNKDMGQKVARSMAQFYINSVKPLEDKISEQSGFVDSLRDGEIHVVRRLYELEDRVAYMSLPVWQRAWIRLRHAWDGSLPSIFFLRSTWNRLSPSGDKVWEVSTKPTEPNAPEAT